MPGTLTVLSRTAAQQILVELGWKIHTPARFDQALTNFQRGWNLGAALKVDGDLGPATSQALTVSQERLAGHRPTASEHFSFTEFACHCQQLTPRCEHIRVHRELVVSLEVLRTRFYPKGLSIVSGYRCPDHNKAIGGASTSQHLFGAAADVRQRVSAAKVADLRVFAGIGKHPKTGKVDHVDRRDVSGHGGGGASVSHPVVFNDPPQ